MRCFNVGEAGGIVMKKRWISIINFAVLAFILILTVFLFWQVRDTRSMQILVGILLSVLYVAWGIIYHMMIRDLHPKIVIEYLLVGCIAVTLIITVVWI